MLTTKKEKQLLVLTCALYVANAIFSIFTTDRIAAVIACAERGEKNSLLMMIAIAVIVVVIEKVSSVGMLIMGQTYLTECDLWNKKHLMRSILRRSIPAFRKKEDGYYTSLLTTDTRMHRGNVLGSYPWIAFFSVYGIMAIVMLVRINIILAAVTLLFSALPMLSEKVLAKYVEKKKDIYSKESAKNLQMIKENLEGFESIKQDGNGEAFEKRYDKIAERFRSAEAASTIAEQLSQEMLYIAASVLRLTALGVGAYFVIQGKFSAAFLYAALEYAIALSNSISNISYYTISIKSTKKITDRLNDEIKMCTQSDGIIRKSGLPEKASTIVFKNFTFSYDSKQLFNDFSYVFEAGKCYAIMGESGKGKTTLIRALLKYYDDYTGQVLIDDVDIKNLDDSEVFSKVAYVNQERWIVNGSLYDNVTMLSDSPKKDSSEYAELLSNLQLSAFAEKAGERSLGDLGGAVSGGEIQRICMARALRHGRNILILDEPTNGLDPENADIINEFIFGLKGVTRIVVTHNWGNDYLKRFDGIVKLT